MEFKPSKYQEEIFNFVRKGNGNAVINAKAGAGKTTTIVNSIKFIKPNKNILFIAFNKSIEEELSKRLSGNKNVDVRTFHSLGVYIARKYIKKDMKVNEYKYTLYIEKNIQDFLLNENELDGNEIRIYKNNLRQLVDFARFNLAQSPKEIIKIANKYKIDCVANECEIVPEILKWGIENLDIIDFNDMVWLCVEKDFNIYKKYDFIFIDEAQDSSIVQQKLIDKLKNRGCKTIAIGDEFQCINAYAGADQDAFKTFIKKSDIILDLPISYRCPKSIIEKVKNKFPEIKIEAAENAIEGKINYDVSLSAPKEGDIVLCRNGLPLVKLYMKYSKINKKSYIKGRDFKEILISILENIKIDDLSLDLEKDGVFPRLYETLFKNINKEILKTGISYENVIYNKEIIDFIDIIRTLEVLSEGCFNKDCLFEKIKVIFIDDDEFEKRDVNKKETKEDSGVCLSTIHKAKGLEYDNVYILCPSLIPSRHAKKDWEIKSEKNLEYVAMTRAKKTLNYISEKEFPTKIYETDIIIKDIEKIREKLNKNLNLNIEIIKNDDK